MMDAAVAAVRSGHCIGLPTETVYGLAVDACNGAAVAQLYALKGRPSFNPLIVHVADISAAERVMDMTPDAKTLAAAFWPGPLTLVGRRIPQAGLSDLVTAGLETVAVRVPAHPVAAAFLRAFGGPVAAPSANRSGTPSPTTAAHVVADFGKDIPLVLDGGPCAAGLESTVVDITAEPAVILRLGAVPRDAVAAVVRLADGLGAAARSPGRLARHYAPVKPLRLNVAVPSDDEAYLSFGTCSPYALSASGDVVEAAANLYAQLRAADASAFPRIAVAPIPHSGLGEALNDRLARAAGMVG